MGRQEAETEMRVRWGPLREEGVIRISARSEGVQEK